MMILTEQLSFYFCGHGKVKLALTPLSMGYIVTTYTILIGMSWMFVGTVKKQTMQHANVQVNRVDMHLMWFHIRLTQITTCLERVNESLFIVSVKGKWVSWKL